MRIALQSLFSTNVGIPPVGTVNPYTATTTGAIAVGTQTIGVASLGNIAVGATVTIDPGKAITRKCRGDSDQRVDGSADVHGSLRKCARSGCRDYRDTDTNNCAILREFRQSDRFRHANGGDRPDHANEPYQHA